MEEDVYDHYLEINDYEEEHKGAWQRIFPAEDDGLNYDILLEGSKKVWQETTGIKLKHKEKE